MLAHEQFIQRYLSAWCGGKRLRPNRAGNSVRAGVVTDGAFTETKEVLGGYYLIEAADLGEAVAIAKGVPAPFGRIEVRPVWPAEY